MKVFKSAKSISRSSIAATLLVASVGFFVSCNKNDSAGVKVAGGEIDGSGDKAKYPGTVYAELAGTDLNKKPFVIRNVATIVDVGLANHYALVLSLADALVEVNGKAQMPLLKEGTISIWMTSGEDKIVLPGMSLQKEGFLKDKQGRSYLMLTMGMKAEKVGSSKLSDADARKLEDKFFYKSDLMAGSENYRIPATSYSLIAVPKNAHPSIQALTNVPKLVSAESRVDAEKYTMVGYGETTVGGVKSKEFSLGGDLPSIMKRNFAEVELLSETPLKKKHAGALSKVLPEFKKAGLCGSSDGKNYDTGASIYQADGSFVAFSVVSSTESSGFKGKLSCAATGREDMVTLTVAPTDNEIAEFKRRVK